MSKSEWIVIGGLCLMYIGITAAAFWAAIRDDPEPLHENGQQDEDETRARLEEIGYL